MPLPRHLIAGAMILATTAPSPALADVRVGVEAWQNGNYVRAVAEWRPLAEQGDPDAQFNLAQAYKLGRGVTADLKLARSWYQKAARQDHWEAQASLGLVMFQEGEHEAGMPWIRMAAENGDPRARYVLATTLFNGEMTAKDWPRAFALMTRAAAQGLPSAATSLGEMENIMPEAQLQQGIELARELARTDAAREAAPVAAASKEATPSTEVAGSGQPQTVALQPVKYAPPAPPKPALALPAPPMKAASLAPAQPAANPARSSARIALDGRWRVQLGAYSSVELARGQWTMLSKKIGLLGGVKPSYEPFDALTRLRVNSLADRSAAHKLCAASKAAGQACFAIAP